MPSYHVDMRAHVHYRSLDVLSRAVKDSRVLQVNQHVFVNALSNADVRARRVLLYESLVRGIVSVVTR